MPSGPAAKMLQVISNAVEAGEEGGMMGNITWINRLIYKALSLKMYPLLHFSQANLSTRNTAAMRLLIFSIRNIYVAF